MLTFKTVQKTIFLWRRRWYCMDRKWGKKRKDFIPDIFFTKLRIFNKDYNISEFEKAKVIKEKLY